MNVSFDGETRQIILNGDAYDLDKGKLFSLKRLTYLDPRKREYTEEEYSDNGELKAIRNHIEEYNQFGRTKLVINSNVIKKNTENKIAKKGDVEQNEASVISTIEYNPDGSVKKYDTPQETVEIKTRGKLIEKTTINKVLNKKIIQTLYSNGNLKSESEIQDGISTRHVRYRYNKESVLTAVEISERLDDSSWRISKRNYTYDESNNLTKIVNKVNDFIIEKTEYTRENLSGLIDEVDYNNVEKEYSTEYEQGPFNKIKSKKGPYLSKETFYNNQSLSGNILYNKDGSIRSHDSYYRTEKFGLKYVLNKCVSYDGLIEQTKKIESYIGQMININITSYELNEWGRKTLTIDPKQDIEKYKMIEILFPTGKATINLNDNKICGFIMNHNSIQMIMAGDIIRYSDIGFSFEGSGYFEFKDLLIKEGLEDIYSNITNMEIVEYIQSLIEF